MTNQTTQAITSDEAEAIVAALLALKTIDDRMADLDYRRGDLKPTDDDFRLTVRMRAVCDLAGDTLFAVLNYASAYGDSREARDAIKRQRDEREEYLNARLEAAAADAADATTAAEARQ